MVSVAGCGVTKSSPTIALDGCTSACKNHWTVGGVVILAANPFEDR